MGHLCNKSAACRRLGGGSAEGGVSRCLNKLSKIDHEKIRIRARPRAQGEPILTRGEPPRDEMESLDADRASVTLIWSRA